MQGLMYGQIKRWINNNYVCMLARVFVRIRICKIHWFIHLYVRSLVRALFFPYNRSFVQSCALVYSFIYSSTHSFFLSFFLSFFHSFIRSFFYFCFPSVDITVRTNIKPAFAVANWVKIHSSIFGPQMPTRSPFLRPRARNPDASFSTYNTNVYE